MIYVILKQVLRGVEHEKGEYDYEYWEIQSLEGYVTGENERIKVLDKLNNSNKNKDTVRYTSELLSELYLKSLD